MLRRSHPSKNIAALGFLFVMLSGIGSCPTSLVQFCGDPLVEYEEDFNRAALALRPWLPDEDAQERRIPASFSPGNLGAKPPVANLPEVNPLEANPLEANPEDPKSDFYMERTDRETWMSWARERLRLTQRYLDLADSDPRLALSYRELSLVADGLVFFHAQAAAGRSLKMNYQLKRISSHAWRARELACNVGSLPERLSQ